MTTATDRPLIPEGQREPLAEYLILARFDTLRQLAYGDMACARRGFELSRRADALIENGVRLVMGGEGPFEGYGFPSVSGQDLFDAYQRVGKPRVDRIRRESYRAETKHTRATLRTWHRVAHDVMRAMTGEG